MRKINIKNVRRICQRYKIFDRREHFQKSLRLGKNCMLSQDAMKSDGMILQYELRRKGVTTSCEFIKILQSREERTRNREMFFLMK